MYEYVRRQQELQPNMFATKTFQWMDGGMRDTSWVKSYSKNTPTDPLAYSSSSLFGGPRVQTKAGALGALQRSAASLTPHRGLFTLRRHRQTSDTTATRPPSGVSGTFWPRRRGFTVPSASQASPFLFSVTAAREPLLQKEQQPLQHPQSWRGRGRGATIAADHCQDRGAMGSDLQQYPPIGTPIAPHHAGTTAAAAAQMPLNREKERLAGEMPVFGSAGSSHNTSSAMPFSSHPPLPPLPQLHSSFSPPTSPRPRTICHRARMLVQRVRTKHHDDSNQHSERTAPQFSLSSVLGASEKAPSDKGSHMFSAGLRAAAGSPKSSHLSPHMSPPKTPSRMLGGRNSKPRVLPRSPLANPLVIAAALPEERAIDDDDYSRLTDGSAATHDNGGIGIAAVDHTNAILSSDEEGLVCQVCQRFKSLEWLVLCNARHPLCFGCVQAHVKRLLANTKACAVVCPFGSCAAAIPTKHLRVCLPPQRMQQLLANRHSRDKSSGPIGRSNSMCTRWNSTYSAGRAGQVNRNDDGFDAPIIVVQESHGAEAGAPPADLHVTHTRFAGRPTFTPGVISDNAQKRLSVSMPALQCPEPEVHSSRDTTGPLLSECTSVGPGSVDSVVIAASIAADSAQTLSPESVGSRLRRVPKAQEHLDTHAWGVSSRPQAHHPQHVLRMSEDSSASVFEQSSSPLDVSPSVLSTSPISWLPPAPTAAEAIPTTMTARTMQTPPPLPPPFRTSATWITPGQRHSGYAEDMLLSATLFETIRRKAPSDDDDDDYDSGILDHLSASNYHQPPPRLPLQRTVEHPLPIADDNGVYIPSWRTPSAARQHTLPLWADIQYESQQSGILSEAAALNFDLYETLHRRH
ncbi:hypothetical protein H4R24_000133 [Coemansia sp. RSA 988]|nr:hypothetical protein H4R24_000133 [Coemansia sp. RSA 988]